MESSKIYQAIISGKEDDILVALADPENEPELKLRDSDGNTMLHIAAMKVKSANVFKELLQKVDYQIRNEDGDSAIDLILHDEDFPDEIEEELEKFLRKRCEIGPNEELEDLALHGWLDWFSIFEDEDEDLDDEKKEVKKEKAKIPERSERIKTLHKSIEESNWDKAKELLEDKTLFKAVDKAGVPPLHKAVIFGEAIIAENIAKEFVEALTLKDNMGRTPLHHAAGRRDGGQLYQLLVDAGALDDVTDMNGKTPKEIFESPALLPNERTLAKLKASLAKPTLTKKRKKQVQSEQQTDATEDGKPSSPTEKTKSPKPKAKIEEKPKPVQMYISPDVRPNPPPTTIDGKYVADHLGLALTEALSEIAEKRPWDPIEYLGQWLYKYHAKMAHNQRQKELLAQIREEEKAKELEREIREKRKAELQRLQEEERRKKQAEEDEKKRKEQEELQRKAKEAALSQQPGLETVMEDKEEDEMPQEKSHKDSSGQTELHKLAAQSAADLTTLLNMGYSPADRDINNKTARDVALENNVKENVDAIDKYVLRLVEMEEFEKIQELLLAGYDKFDVVMDKLKEQTTSLPEETKQFLDDLPDLQNRISGVFSAVQKEGLRELSQALERKKLAEAKDVQGRSPLHIAILVGNMEAVEHLAKNFPAAVRCKDNLDRTPLHYAMAMSEEMASLLEKYGADTLAKDVQQNQASYYKDNPEDIKTMANSFESAFTGTLGQTEESTERAPSQQEVTSQETTQQEATQQEATQQEAT